MYASSRQQYTGKERCAWLVVEYKDKGYLSPGKLLFERDFPFLSCLFLHPYGHFAPDGIGCLFRKVTTTTVDYIQSKKEERRVLEETEGKKGEERTKPASQALFLVHSLFRKNLSLLNIPLGKAIKRMEDGRRQAASSQQH